MGVRDENCCNFNLQLKCVLSSSFSWLQARSLKFEDQGGEGLLASLFPPLMLLLLFSHLTNLFLALSGSGAWGGEFVDS